MIQMGTKKEKIHIGGKKNIETDWPIMEEVGRFL